MLLGERTGVWSGGGGGGVSARDYKQGLFLFDAEENVGFGQFENNPVRWQNLWDSNSYVADFAGTWTWSEQSKSVIAPTNANNAKIYGISDNVQTIEAVLSVKTASGYQVGIVFDRIETWIGVRANNTINFGNGGYYANIQRNRRMSVSAVGDKSAYLWFAGSGTKSIFVNGIEAVVKSQGMTNGGVGSYLYNFNPLNSSVSFEWMCIRGYEEQLTNAERLENYAVDVARFGLT